MSEKTPKERLFIAVQKGNKEEIEKLMRENSISANVVDERGDTPLHHAAALGQVEVAKFLVNIGAEINAENNGGGTPLYIAASFGKINVAKFLIEKVEEFPIEKVKAYVNKADNIHGYTPLHVAAQKGYMDIVQLLDSKADLTLKDKYDKTPMYYLCNYLKENRQISVQPNVRDTLIKSVKIGCTGLLTGAITLIMFSQFIELPPSISAESAIVFSVIGKIAFSAIGATALAATIASAYIMLKPSTEMQKNNVEEHTSPSMIGVT